MAVIINQIANRLRDPYHAKASEEYKRILVKDMLISHVLYFLYNHDSYRRLNFYGGTCAHVVYDLNRLSEDIDLDNSGQINLDHLSTDLEKFIINELGIINASVHIQNGESGISRWTIKVPILHDLNLSSLADEKLHLKIEVSHHKQTAIILKTPIMRDGRTMVIAHFDKPSLMAGKMLACLERQWHTDETSSQVKGRDFYDLLWYIQTGVKPNELKLAKDGKRSYSVKEALELLAEKIGKLKKSDLAKDLYNFLPEKTLVEAWLDNFQEFYKREINKFDS